MPYVPRGNTGTAGPSTSVLSLSLDTPRHKLHAALEDASTNNGPALQHAAQAAVTTSSRLPTLRGPPDNIMDPRVLQDAALDLQEDQTEDEQPSMPPLAAAARTAVELRDAIQAGTQHIVIKNHMDLSNLERVDDAFGNRVTLAAVPDTVKSITGDCRSSPRLRDFNLFSAATPLLDLKPRQCLIMTNNTFISMVSQLWVSTVYVRLKEPDDDDAVLFAADGTPLKWPKPLFVHAPRGSGGLWLTDVTMQGDGMREVQGVDTADALVAEGCSFSHLGGLEPAIALRGDGTTAAFSQCEFQDNAGQASVIIVASGAGAVWLQGCTFASNRSKQPLGDLGSPAMFFSDQQLSVWDMETNATRSTEWLKAKPDSIQFLNTSNSWLLSVQEEVTVSSSLLKDDGFPGPLGLWSFTGVMMGVAAIVIAVVVYFAPAPPQCPEPNMRRRLAHATSIHSRSRAQYQRQSSRASASCRSHATERDSSRLARTDSRGVNHSPTGRDASSSGLRMSPRFADAAPGTSRSPMHVDRIPEQGYSSAVSAASEITDDPLAPRIVDEFEDAAEHSPRHPRRGGNTQRLSTSTRNSSLTFAKGSGGNLRQMDSHASAVERVVSGGSGGRISATRTPTAGTDYHSGERDIFQQQIDLALRDLNRSDR